MKVINNSVIHFEKEEQVGLILDYNQAAILLNLICRVSTTCAITNHLAESMAKIDVVDKLDEQLEDYESTHCHGSKIDNYTDALDDLGLT